MTTEAEHRALVSAWLDDGDMLAALRILLEAIEADWAPPLSDAERWATEPTIQREGGHR